MTTNKKINRASIRYLHERKERGDPKNVKIIRAHFKKRVHERTKIKLNKNIRNILKNMVFSKEYIIIEIQSSSKELLRLEYMNRYYYFVWNRRIKEFVTCLTKDMVVERLSVYDEFNTLSLIEND